MHFPVRPVRSALELGDEPAPVEAIELGLGQGPEPLAAGNGLGGTGRSEMDVGFSGIERHEHLQIGSALRARMLPRADAEVRACAIDTNEPRRQTHERIPRSKFDGKSDPPAYRRRA